MNSELCWLFQTERFAKVVSDLKLLTIFVERFVLHDWWSSESASTHCNSLVFLWLFIIVIIAIFLRCSYQLLVRTHHNNFSATFYWALYDLVYLFIFPFVIKIQRNFINCIFSAPPERSADTSVSSNSSKSVSPETSKDMLDS